MVTTGSSCFCRCWISVMGILPVATRVTAASHFWPYGHNQTKANVPAVSCIIAFAMARTPDGCDLEANIWHQLDKQVLFVPLPLKNGVRSQFYSVWGSILPHRELVQTHSPSDKNAEKYEQVYFESDVKFEMVCSMILRYIDTLIWVYFYTFRVCPRRGVASALTVNAAWKPELFQGEK